MKPKKTQKKKTVQKKVKKQVKPIKKSKVAKAMKTVVKKQRRQTKQVIKKKPIMPEKKIQRKESKDDINYVEVKVKCTECGKEVKIVTFEGSDNSEYLCQKCSTGEFLDDDDDF